MKIPTPSAQASVSDLPSYAWEPGQEGGYQPQTEWVLAMGNGSFAMGSIDGTLRRRYHGVLIASQSPPVRRMNLVSAVDECVRITQEQCCTPELAVHLTRFRFGDDAHGPTTMPGLVGFEQSGGTCVWTYHIPTQQGAISIRKTLMIGDRTNTSVLSYEIQSPVDASMTITPLLAMRDFHELNHPGTVNGDHFRSVPLDEAGIQGVRVEREGLAVNLRGVLTAWNPAPSVYHNIVLDHETQRGQPDREDLCAVGHWEVPIKRGIIQTTRIELSDGPVGAVDWNAQSTQRRSRVRSSVDHALSAAGDPEDASLRETIAMLAQASDSYVVDRDATTSIIAGYPWFSDWGRDTMIALPGLLLVTGRHDEALAALTTFARARDHGLIPNRFDDHAGPAHFNTVDASLWFIHACACWSQATGYPLTGELDEACDDILSSYTLGTIHNIVVDPIDGLVKAGSDDTQLTWMDAQRQGVTFTPRHGKPIEIQALWIQSLRAYAKLISEARPTLAMGLRAQADLAQSSLLTHMVNGPSRGLVDCLVPVTRSRGIGWERSLELRPNQVFAVSLPEVQLPVAVRDESINAVWGSLVTPAGLRTLAPHQPNYHPHYEGTLMERDSAYHNGTVWPWLLGPACEALLRTRGFDARSRASAIEQLSVLASNMKTDSVGQLHEIYDADPDPVTGHHHPDGCPAQAWSIAETLRVLVLASNHA